jgi:periplasmic copper chaperone A
MKNLLKATMAAVGLALVGIAQAHVVLEQPKAAGGSSYRASFRVGHGCAGAPTTGISVRIPDGVQGAKPMPKPGWTLATRTEKLAMPYTSHGRRVEADVVEITWTAVGKDNALPDAHYDEFVLRVGLPAKPGPLWFKVIQTCDDNGRTSRNEWTQVPAEGTSTRGMASPAALLVVEPPAEAHHH